MLLLILPCCGTPASTPIKQERCACWPVFLPFPLVYPVTGNCYSPLRSASKIPLLGETVYGLSSDARALSLNTMSSRSTRTIANSRFSCLMARCCSTQYSCHFGRRHHLLYLQDPFPLLQPGLLMSPPLHLSFSGSPIATPTAHVPSDRLPLLYSGSYPTLKPLPLLGEVVASLQLQGL